MADTHKISERERLEDIVISEAVVTSLKDQVSCDLDGETIILNLADGQYYQLNGVAGWIWAQIKQPRRFGELLEAVLGEFDVKKAECERDLLTLFREMAAKGLIDIRNETTT